MAFYIVNCDADANAICSQTNEMSLVDAEKLHGRRES